MHNLTEYCRKWQESQETATTPLADITRKFKAGKYSGIKCGLGVSPNHLYIARTTPDEEGTPKRPHTKSPSRQTNKKIHQAAHRSLHNRANAANISPHKTPKQSPAPSSLSFDPHLPRMAPLRMQLTDSEGFMNKRMQ